MNIQFANDNAEMVTMVNEMTIGADGWAQIAPYGDYVGMAMIADGKGGFTKEKAIQRLDKLAVTQMANEYQQASKGLSGFFRKRPIYEGHPDIPMGSDRYPNKEPQGVFYNIEAREDGLYGQPIMTESGEQLIASKKYRALSGRWSAEFVAKENGVNIYRPVKFLSAGLTNQPNLPVQLLNEAESTSTNQNKMKNLIAWLKKHGITIANEATEAQVDAALAQLDPKLTSAVTLANEKATADGTITTLKTEKGTLETQLQTAKTEFANERKARIAGEIGHALTSGRITAADKATWETRLGIEAQFANELTALHAIKPIVKTESVTITRGGNKVEIANESQRRELQAEVMAEIANEKHLDGVKDYDKIWQLATKRHPELFNAMKHPVVKVH